MKRKARLFFIAPAAIVGITLFMGIGGWIVMHLWNWLLPGIFGWRMITFWQALGMLVLCRILFGNHSWRGGPRSGMRERMRERMGARWPEMTPEQREKMRQRWATVCGFEPPASESHES
jgi:hypothetical protein